MHNAVHVVCLDTCAVVFLLLLLLQLDRTREELHLLAFEARQALLYYDFKRAAFADVLREGGEAVALLQLQVAGLVADYVNRDRMADAPIISRNCMHMLAVQEAKLFVLRQVDARMEVMQNRSKDLFVAILG